MPIACAGDRERLSSSGRRSLRARPRLMSTARLGRRRGHDEAIGAWRDKGEAIVARREIIGRAACIGDALAGDDARRIGRDAVIAEHLRRLAGGGVDEGDAASGDGRAIAAVENDAERID